MIERALEIAEGDVRVHTKPFDLVKDRGVRRIWCVVTVYLARTYDAHWGPHLLHRADLYRRRVRAQHQAIALLLLLLVRDEKRVLGIARRMVRWEIQRFKIVVVAFDFRPLGDGVAHLHEDIDEFVQNSQNRMLNAERLANAGEGHIDALSLQLRGSAEGGVKGNRILNLFNVR